MNRILNRVRQKFHEEFVYRTTEIKQNRLTTRWANEQPLSFSLFLSPSPPLPNRSNTQDTNFPIESSPERFQFSCTNSRPAWNEEADCFFFCFFPQTWRFERVEKKGKIKERKRERDSTTPDVEQVRKVRVSDCRMQLLPFSRACHGN